jgi:hypothetical protein
MNTLYLTAEEQKVFNGIPEAPREGWEVSQETGTFEDNEERLSMRMALLRLHDPKLLDFQKRAADLSPEQLTALIAETDLKGVADADLAELTFAIGPVILGRVIGGLLLQAKTDADMEDLAALTVIRHSLLASFVKA